MSDTPSPARRFHLPTLTRRRAAQLFGDETGAATAEYAIATIVRQPAPTGR